MPLPADPHTDIYEEPLHYDAKFHRLKVDIPFYYGCALRWGGPVLELACGTGRITVPLASMGVEIEGMDCSQDMLAQAQKKAEDEGVSIKWHRGDMIDFNLPGRYPSIFIPFNSISHLADTDSLVSCLTSAEKHLFQGGRVVVDAMNPGAMDLSDTVDEPIVDYDAPRGEGRVKVLESHSWNEESRIRTITWRHVRTREHGQLVQTLAQRLYTMAELEDAVIKAGLIAESFYGWFDKTGVLPHSPKIIMVLKRAGQ